MANAPTAAGAKPAALVEYWKTRKAELREMCNLAVEGENLTAASTLARQCTLAEVAHLEAEAAEAAERERLSSTGDQLERIVAVIKKLPLGARQALMARLVAELK